MHQGHVALASFRDFGRFHFLIFFVKFNFILHQCTKFRAQRKFPQNSEDAPQAAGAEAVGPVQAVEALDAAQGHREGAHRLAVRRQRAPRVRRVRRPSRVPPLFRRAQLMKLLWAHIKAKNLQDPRDKR